MKYHLVGTFAILLVILSFTTSQTDTNLTFIPETYNLIDAATANLPIAKPGCKTTCGDLIVPYPFGIGLDSKCSIDSDFAIYCNTTSEPHKAFFTKDGQYGWIKNISDSTLRTSNLVAERCYNTDGSILTSYKSSYDFSRWPAYTFSQVNRFTVIGCDDYAWLTSGTKAKEVFTGCMVFCSNDNTSSENECSGNGCCESSIPRDISYYTTRINNLSSSDDINMGGCTYAFVGEQNTFKYSGSMALSDLSSFSKKIEDNIPVVLDWAIGNQTCAEAKLAIDGRRYACQSNTVCVDSERESRGYRCQCIQGYQGSPYLFPGCQDINECNDPEKHSCYGICKNSIGNFTCKCKKGYSGDPRIPYGCQRKPFHQTLLFYLGIGLSLPVIVIGLLVLYFIAQKRKLIKLKEKYYEQNGGVLLKEKLKTKSGVGLNSVNIFLVKELKEATDNFTESKVIGRGGNGTVYKGTLKDKRFVAIKKSQKYPQELLNLLDLLNNFHCFPSPSKISQLTVISSSLYVGIGLSLPVIVIGLLVLHFIAQKRKLVRLKEKYYEQNGGALLKEKLKTKSGVGLNSVNIFLVKELKEATDNFAESKVIGRGGNGTVYKGTLKDQRFVAIKKSQKVDQGQREEFINEMVILTQINHTNVVQLLGVCLETDVPLLVYEFVSNNTLHHHIHNRKSGTKRLSWDTRLRIAHESAGALAYLHTDARMSIIHRDVKSTNILLDENYTAKIADFGASRLVPLGHDEVVTLVQGTFGYLDPEYFHTGQLTDRSDVYSFGVVLAELLTGQQPLNMERCLAERNLATYFVKAVKENIFLDILEHDVVKEADFEQLKAIGDLVCRCVNQVGENRPSMKEVTMELDMLRKLGKHTNWVGEDNYNERSSLLIETDPTDLYTVPLMPRSDTFGNTSITSEMQEMMLRVQSAR